MGWVWLSRDHPRVAMSTLLRLKKRLCKRKRSARASADASERDRGRKVKKRRKRRDVQATGETEDEKIAAFARWCSEVGIELHPRVSEGGGDQ